MPTENKEVEPGFDLNTPGGGRGYIAHLFKTVLKRHDYRQYINERLAGDFACTMAQHFEDIKAREEALQQRLNAADQRIDELTQSPFNHIVEANGMAMSEGTLTDQGTIFDDGLALIEDHRRFIAGEYEDLVDQASDFQDRAYALGIARGKLKAASASVRTVPGHIGATTEKIDHPADPERERLMEIVERYPNGDPLEYDAALRKIQQ